MFCATLRRRCKFTRRSLGGQRRPISGVGRRVTWRPRFPGECSLRMRTRNRRAAGIGIACSSICYERLTLLSAKLNSSYSIGGLPNTPWVKKQDTLLMLITSLNIHTVKSPLVSTCPVFCGPSACISLKLSLVCICLINEIECVYVMQFSCLHLGVRMYVHIICIHIGPKSYICMCVYPCVCLCIFFSLPRFDEIK